VVVGFTVLGVLGLVLLPAEHLHQSASHDGHHPDVIHRHLQPHHVFEHHDANTTIDHGEDDNARYLSAVFVGPKAASGVVRVQSFVIADFPLAFSAQITQWTFRALNVHAHDPPWRTSSGLRAPPLPV
jgi:hypothetical protein